jgi:hypothetical protein
MVPRYAGLVKESFNQLGARLPEPIYQAQDRRYHPAKPKMPSSKAVRVTHT